MHQLGASELLQLMTVLGDAPERVSLVGAPFECLDWGRALSPALAQCLPQACESLAALLGSGGIDLERRTACTN
ncbi:hypothetical protein [Marinobacterium aestuariivivens]|uniref:Hydrogenase maturation protease n=1 Tax=Marinobacterium aestuariivivens TaxID=1698799 RepID=A0ABW2A1W7_9GAMM